MSEGAEEGGKGEETGVRTRDGGDGDEGEGEGEDARTRGRNLEHNAKLNSST